MRRSNSFARRGLVAALEDENLPIEGEEGVPAEAAGAETLETDLIEVADSTAEGEAEQAQTEEATEVAEALESIADGLKVCAANGGLSKEAAGVLGDAVGFMYSRVGVRAKAMPALESFGQGSSRTGATTLAMEDIKEQVAKIWKAIVDAIKRAAEWVMDHFNKIFGAGEKLQKRAQALAKAAEGTTGKAKNAKFENPGLVKALHTGGDVKNITAGIASVVSLAKAVLDTNAAATLKTGDQIVEAIEDPAAKGAAIQLAAVKDNAGGAYGEAGDGLAFERSSELPGGMAFVSRGPLKALSGVEALAISGKIRSGIQAFDPKAKAPSKTEVSTLSTADCEKIAKDVEAIGSELQSFRKTQSKLKELLGKAQKAADKASKAVDGEEDASKKDALKAVRSAAGNLPAMLIGPYKSVSEYALRTGKAALDYAELSLKQYEAA